MKRLLLASFLPVILLALQVPAGAGALAACHSTSRAVMTGNAKAEKTTKKLLANPNYTPLTRTYTPAPTSHVKFVGYETIEVKAPKGTAPVSGYFELSGADPCSIIVTSAQVVLGRNAYVVKLKFPGEQGSAGNLKVTLVSS